MKITARCTEYKAQSCYCRKCMYKKMETSSCFSGFIRCPEKPFTGKRPHYIQLKELK